MKHSRQKSKPEQSQSGLSKGELTKLQKAVLEAVLLGKPLPGSTQPIKLPDLTFILRQDNVYLAKENLEGRITITGAPKPVQIVPIETLRQKAEKQGDIAYLQFRPPAIKAGTVHLALEGKIASADPNRKPYGLSTVTLSFQKIGQNWELMTQPVYLAA